MRVNTKKARLKKLRGTIIILMLLVHIENNVNVKQRRWWVRPWLKKKKGNLALVHNEFKSDQEQFKNYLRMDIDIFNLLLLKVAPKISKQDTFLRKSISARDRLTVTLRFLATGESYRSLMYTFRISESTISIFVPEVCRAIYDCLKDEFLKVPSTPNDWLAISNDFETLWNFPNCIGALDGKHIVFKAPRSAGSTFFNYKNQHSIVLLALVDANYKFIYVDVGTNGRVSDGLVFRNSSLNAALLQDKLNLPADKPLPGRDSPMPHVFVADAAFPLSEHILKPFPFRNMTEEQKSFNARLSRARRVVENAFGILANRFRIFLTTINLGPDKVQTITLACVALHNFLRSHSIQYVQDNEEFDENFIFNFNLVRQAGNRSNATAMGIRKEFMEYINNAG